jgi:hypothetical protein
VDESSPNIIVGWWELEKLLLSLLPPHTGKGARYQVDHITRAQQACSLNGMQDA